MESQRWLTIGQLQNLKKQTKSRKGLIDTKSETKRLMFHSLMVVIVCGSSLWKGKFRVVFEMFEVEQGRRWQGRRRPSLQSSLQHSSMHLFFSCLRDSNASSFVFWPFLRKLHSNRIQIVLVILRKSLHKKNTMRKGISQIIHVCGCHNPILKGRKEGKERQKERETERGRERERAREKQ